MNIAIIIAVGYVAPLLILRHLIRKLAMVTAQPPDAMEMVINVIPVLNIACIPVVYLEIRQKKSARTVAEVFYNIPKDGDAN